MIRMGLQLTLHSGREAFVRLAVTTIAVAAGAALLLGVLAEFHAYNSNANQPCWSCTYGSALPPSLPARGDLWNNSVDFYQGQTISRLDVAALGPAAPVPPGISRLPGPAQFYASPALAALLRTVPADELGDRFPGKMIGTIGDAALSGPEDLVVYIGYTPSSLARIPGTQWVTRIATAPAPEVFTPFFRDAFGIGALAVLFPMLILIGTATRLAAARREERFAALRLVGATPRDVGVMASVEAVVSAFLGVVLGVVVFLLVRPELAGAALIGTKYFPGTVTPTIWGYIAMLVAVPVAAAIAALLSLRRVQISPLGAARRATPRPPRLWRLLPLAMGVALYVFGLWTTNSRVAIGPATYPGLLLTMIGLVVAGPWLTWATASLFARVARGPSPLLATRRLTDNPRVASRAVSGLVLAAFLGTMMGVLLPAVESIEKTPNAGSLSNVLVDQVGLSPRAGATLVGELRGFKGATVYPLYSLPLPAGSGAGNGQADQAGPGQNGPGYDTVVGCAVMRGLTVLGQCRPGAQAVQTTDDSLFSDNPFYSTKAFVSAADRAYRGTLSALPLQAVLVRVNSSATLERVRTFLATHTPPPVSGGPGSAPTPPRTFAETIAIRTGRAATVEKMVYAAVALTVVVAGCSLAVAAGGALVERKRPFTLLRVTGTPVGTLSKVVLLEAVFPLAVATVIAAGIAYGTSVLAFVRLAPPGTAIPQLGPVYYATMGTGLAIAILAILATVPLLRRMTGPASIRFE
jgi:hypothetical protein